MASSDLSHQFLAKRYAECVELAKMLKKHWMISVLMIGGYFISQHWLFVNLTDSLPYRLVWIDYGVQPVKGDLMVYRFDGHPFHDEDLTGLRFFKRVGGVAGEQIEVQNGVVSVAGRTVGMVKRRTRTFEKLTPVSPGAIPAGHYFAESDSPDSFDSRYAECGLVRADQVIGVAHVVF